MCCSPLASGGRTFAASGCGHGGQRVLWVPSVQDPAIRCLAQMCMGGCCADGADMAARGAAGDEVSQGPLSSQGTHRAAHCVAVNKGELQPVDAGRADGAL